MRVLVTGSAGFIGNHVSLRLLEEGRDVVGIDNLNSYYDVNLKRRRIERLTPFENYINAPIDINDQDKLNKVFKDYKIDQIIHLAAQAGVRHSLTAPRDYIDANISGFLNILEACRNFSTKHLVYASTSSVYGGNTKIPFSEHDGTNHPKSIYAATKKTNELMAHCYSHLFNFPVTGLRFFTVYGPWGRPDMALFKFTKAILNNKPIDLYNNGNMKRDFTYIDDIVESITHILAKAPEIDSNWNSNLPDPATSGIAPYRVYNIGSSNPVNLMDFVEILEIKLGREAVKNYMPMQPGDVDTSWANADELAQNIGYTPITPIDKGIHNFVDWYLDYFEIRN
jgi:UDP-glucuronate 4-epimerase